MKGSLDTNIVLRLILDDVPAQTILANRLLLSAGSASLTVDPQVFVEAEYALRTHYQYTRAQIAHGLVAFLGQPELRCQAELMRQVFALYVNHPNLSLVDIYLVVSAEQGNRQPLYTFDQNLAKHLKSAQLVA